MAIIPADEKVFMVDKRTNTTYGGSQALQDMQQWYTMQDVADSVQPYKVFTALLTQNGASNWVNQTSGTFTVGVTYTFDTYNGIDDFSNIGGPSAAPMGTWDGYSFIATGTTPLVYTNLSSIDHNTGAPVATILENTIGNIWFIYKDSGAYEIRSSDLFLDNKTTLSINLMGNNPTNGFVCLGAIQNTGNLGIVTGKPDGGYQDNILVLKTPIEIRVYN